MSSHDTAGQLSAALATVEFVLGGDVAGAVLSGFSSSEPVGTWSLDDHSTVILPRPDTFERLELAVTLLPFTSPRGPLSQELRVSVNGQEMFTRRYDGWATLRMRLPAACLRTSETITIGFHHPEATAPALVSDTPDGRRLGFLFARLELRDAAGAVTGRRPSVPPSALLAEPVFHLEPQAGLGGRMFQYLVARKLQSLVPGCRISNIELPEWGIRHPALPVGGPVLRHSPVHRLELESIAGSMNTGAVRRCEWGGLGQRLENLPSLEECRAMLPPARTDVCGFGEAELVIHLRGEEIFAAVDPDYPLAPIAYLREIVARSGLRPVFVGQIGRNRYVEHLRGAFPAGIFLPPREPDVDFEIIRRSRNIAVSTGGLAWLAAWLSEARQIFLPVSGAYSPFQCPQRDLVPLDDPRYRFTLFPITYAEPADAFDKAHDPLDGLWREVTPAMLRELMSHRPRFQATLSDHLALFDEAHYLAHHPQIAQAVAAGWFASAREHFEKVGFAQRIVAFRFDTPWYSRAYPLAALEVGQGDFLTLADHYVAVGSRRGYHAVPS